MIFFKTSQGYTLLEMLVVLSICGLFVSLIPVLTINLKEKTDANFYLNTFQEDLYLAQQWAITKQEPVTFTYMYSTNLYFIKETDGTVIIKRELPANVKILQSSMNNFRYTINGTINSFGTIYFQIDNQTYRIVVNIGRGRFQVYEPAN